MDATTKAKERVARLVIRRWYRVGRDVQRVKEVPRVQSPGIAAHLRCISARVPHVKDRGAYGGSYERGVLSLTLTELIAVRTVL